MTSECLNSIFLLVRIRLETNFSVHQTFQDLKVKILSVVLTVLKLKPEMSLVLSYWEFRSPRDFERLSKKPFHCEIVLYGDQCETT